MAETLILTREDADEAEAVAGSEATMMTAKEIAAGTVSAGGRVALVGTGIGIGTETALGVEEEVGLTMTKAVAAVEEAMLLHRGTVAITTVAEVVDTARPAPMQLRRPRMTA